MSGNCCTNCCYGCMYFTQQIHENYIKNNRPVQIILGVIGGMLLMVILLAIFGAFRSTACAPCTGDQCYYNLFTKSWAQTTCKEFEASGKHCFDLDKLPKSLTIHGLWPQLRQKKAYLHNCNDHPDDWDLAKIQDLVGKLNIAWPTVDNASTNEAFWHHEWDKHGRCGAYDIKNYFERTLQLDTNYPISKWLEEAKIVPTNLNLVSRESFKKALDPKVGADQYLLTCAEISFTVPNQTKPIKQTWLQDISVCVQYVDSVKATKCDISKVPNADQICPDKFFYVADYKTMKPDTW